MIFKLSRCLPFLTGFLKRFIWPFQKVTFDVPFFNLPLETGAGPVAISKAKKMTQSSHGLPVPWQTVSASQMLATHLPGSEQDHWGSWPCRKMGEQMINIYGYFIREKHGQP